MNEMNVKMLNEMNEDKNTELHYTLVRQSRKEDKLSLQDFEEIVQKRIEFGDHMKENARFQLPLHVAIDVQTHPRIVKLLLDAAPQHALRPGGTYGYRPLMMAIMSQSPYKFEIVELCLKARPQFDIDNPEDNYLLSTYPEVIALLIKYVPGVACQVSRYGMTLLHKCIHCYSTLKLDVDTARLLVEANPAALFRLGGLSDPALPIHQAADFASPEVLEYLISAAPETATMEMRPGRTPLKIASYWADAEQRGLKGGKDQIKGYHRRLAVIAKYDPEGVAVSTPIVREVIRREWAEMARERRELAMKAWIRLRREIETDSI